MMKKFIECVEKLLNYSLYKRDKTFEIFLFQSLNGGLVMVSFDSAHLSCGDKASLFDVIGNYTKKSFPTSIRNHR